MKLTDDGKDETEDRELARALGELPRSVEPPRDLWTGVSARIQMQQARARRAHRAGAAAAVLLAAASVMLAIRVSPQAPVARGAAPAPTSESRAAPVERASAAWDTDPVVPEEAAYHAAVAALAPTFEQRLGTLPKADADAIGKSVGAIDEAISATRGSLEETPDDATLRTELGDEYEQKIQTMNDVLDWTTRS